MKKSEIFQKDGIVTAKIYSAFEILKLRKFVHSWISKNFVNQGIDKDLPNNLSLYHSWAKTLKVIGIGLKLVDSRCSPLNLPNFY